VRREDEKDKALELGGPDRLSMDEIIRTVQKVLGKKRPLFHQPASLMKLAARPMALLPEPPLSPSAIDFILQEVDLDPKPAMEYFGFTFRRLEEGLREYLR
jgi:NADH dehydrogenase